ncbi:hypothetical protein VP01_5141g1 [Puccinia sorghi]|uniref:Uncharacterized protein n=1 Tax=Puccinia sorghi TaxID=27349 RepID=A0A0L6UL00_9BASI|nr:hypothetical protein VP01_5141g1 [Puccinia sorghi]
MTDRKLSLMNAIDQISTPSEFFFSFFKILRNLSYIIHCLYGEDIKSPILPIKQSPKLNHPPLTSRLTSSILTPLLPVVKMITLALQGKHDQIISKFHQQNITSLKNIDSIFSLCYEDLQIFSPNSPIPLISAENKITCKHKISQLLDSGKCVKPEEFHPQYLKDLKSELLSGR